MKNLTTENARLMKSKSEAGDNTITAAQSKGIENTRQSSIEVVRETTNNSVGGLITSGEQNLNDYFS